MIDVASTTVLIVDDEEPVRDGLARLLTRLGYRTLTATGGSDCLSLIADHDVHVVLLDVIMPDASGHDVVTDALETDPHLGIVMLSGRNDALSAALCMQRGALDYLTKPVDVSTLDRAIRRAVVKRDAQRHHGTPARRLRTEIEELTLKLQDEQRRMMDVALTTVGALVNAVEGRDDCFSGHSARVASVAATIAADMGLLDDEVEEIRTAGRLHDIGVIGIPDSILSKPGALTPDETDRIRTHVEIGFQLLSPWPLGDVPTIVRHHHERWDGTGYPDGRFGEDIPLGARIVGAVEIYDALTSSRSYQQRRTPQQAVTLMNTATKGAVDPAVMDALAAVVKKRQTLTFLSED